MSPPDRSPGGAAPDGWRWFAEERTTPDRDDDGLAASFARCFATPDGVRALDALRAMTAERALGPEVSDAALRHLEGQRQLVATIGALVRRGRDPTR